VGASADNNAHSFALALIGHNKRVLELGPAAGHVTRVLVERGCDVVAIENDAEAAAELDGVAECLVGDLNDASIITKAAEEAGFDVVVAGDVLEHLTDPLATLRACRGVLVPGGYVVISLPNVAHADIALSLLDGRFTYNDTGLLDRTHLRFFTRDSIGELLDHAGFDLLDIRRVIRPIFETELGLDPDSFPPEVVAKVLTHPEAETYQFVVRAVPHDGDLERGRLAERCAEADELARQLRIERVSMEAEMVLLRDELARVAAEASVWHQEAANQAQHVEALLSTKTMRAVAPLRALYSVLRRAGR
jgi:2-polyprenyl-3-methyl-5-hydroxy-6-metoxy-1,4-benzoquinol methylase